MQKETIIHGTQDYPFALYHISSVAPVDEVQSMHWHDETEIFFIHSGQANFCFGQQRRILSAGDAVFIAPGDIHGALKVNGKDCSFTAVVFHERFIYSSSPDVIQDVLWNMIHGVDAGSFFRIQSQEVKTVVERMVKEEQKGIFSPLLSRARLLELIHWMLDGKEDRPQVVLPGKAVTAQIKQAMRIIREHYAESLSSEDVASQVNLSVGYFERMFKLLVGMSPHAFLLYTRIEWGKYMLLNMDMNISTIALQCGFNDFSYFSKCFREATGFTPKQYRQSSQNIKTDHEAQIWLHDEK